MYLQDGDLIIFDIPARNIELLVNPDELTERQQLMEARDRPWEPIIRDRPVSVALQAYASLATSASTGATRELRRVR